MLNVIIHQGNAKDRDSLFLCPATQLWTVHSKKKEKKKTPLKIVEYERDGKSTLILH